jgi:hypothetical protein
MPTKTYHGSCQCKRITFEADIDIAAVGTIKCNCTICWKRRWWSVAVKIDGFRSLTGGDAVTQLASAGGAQRRFCAHCGIIPYGFVEAAEWNDGAYYSVNVACLDDLEPAELLAAPIRHLDGRSDTWAPLPEIRHL